MEETATRATRHVRLAEDLADKLGEVIEIEGGSSAAFLDPLVRTEIEERHRRNLPAILALRQAREAARRTRDDGPVLSNSLTDAEGR